MYMYIQLSDVCIYIYMYVYIGTVWGGGLILKVYTLYKPTETKPWMPQHVLLLGLTNRRKSLSIASIIRELEGHPACSYNGPLWTGSKH